MMRRTLLSTAIVAIALTLGLLAASDSAGLRSTCPALQRSGGDQDAAGGCPYSGPKTGCPYSGGAGPAEQTVSDRDRA